MANKKDDDGVGLILSRFENQKIVIGESSNLDENIVISIMDVRAKQVRLGIKAPGKPIHRHEVWLAIQRGSVDANEPITHNTARVQSKYPPPPPPPPPSPPPIP